VYDGTELFQSSIDNRHYKVRKGTTAAKQLKSDLLATLYKKLEIIINSLKEEPIKTPEVVRLIQNWDAGITIKEIGYLESDAAYVINKKNISICLKNFCDSRYCVINSIENINLLTYVGIHELAHVMSLETGHGDEFKMNFRYLLEYAKKLRYYDRLLMGEFPLYIDLKDIKTPPSYCGVSIKNSIS
jgi:hypothetical protein